MLCTILHVREYGDRPDVPRLFISLDWGTSRLSPGFVLILDGARRSGAGVTSAAVAVGDVNGDGTPDIFVLNGDGIGVLLSLSVTNTKLTSKPNPSVQGQAVTLIATVSTTGQVAPTGKVVFRNGSASIGAASLIGGKATPTKSNLPVGTLSLTAKYQGDTNSLKSTSPVQIQIVNPTSAHP